MTQWIRRITLLLLFIFPLAAYADDLLTIYRLAFCNDPTFKAAYADMLANRENISINRAELFPQVDFVADSSRKRFRVDGTEVINGPAFMDGIPYYDNNTHYALLVTQPIFNYESYARLKNAQAGAKAAQANFCAAAQDLMMRVTRAYIAILQARDILSYTTQQRNLVEKQLKETKEQFAKKLVIEVNVAEVQSRYDQLVGNVIDLQNNLSDRIQDLREIIGCTPTTLAALGPHIPLIYPNPLNMETWIETAKRQNYSLLASRYNTLAARENIKIQEGGHLPTLNAIGTYDYTYDSNINASDERLRIRQAILGITGALPVYHGGKVLAQTRQAQYQYTEACLGQEIALRQTVSTTIRTYKGLLSKIRKIKASQQALTATIRTVKTVTESYKTGARTIVDVVNDQATLLDVQATNSNDRYGYILQLLLLKQTIGTLCIKDLIEINSWLTTEVSLNLNYCNS